jgi:hypothetical protein
VQRVKRGQRLRRVAERQIQLLKVGQEGCPGGGACGSVMFLRKLKRGDGGGDGRRAVSIECLRAANLLPILRMLNEALPDQVDSSKGDVQELAQMTVRPACRSSLHGLPTAY